LKQHKHETTLTRQKPRLTSNARILNTLQKTTLTVSCIAHWRRRAYPSSKR